MMIVTRLPSPRPALLAVAALLAAGSLAAARLAGPTTLLVESQPAGAKVYLSNSLVGRTPCRLTVQAGGGELRLEREGYLPVSERFAGDQQVFVRLRPGRLPVWGAPPESIPGFYPPFRGRPPRSFLTPKNLHLEGQAVALPPGWALDSLEKLTLRCQERTVLLSRSSTVNLETRLGAARRLREAEGWTCVGSRVGARSAWMRLERPEGLISSRAFVFCGEGLDFFYVYPQCPDVFAYTRDLDILVGYLGLRW